ncbi:Kelch-like protein 26 [Mactra antiquata]
MSDSRDAQKVKADNYGNVVLQNLSKLRDRSELCDFKVSADGRVFEVHKCLLAATSDYFRVMFGGLMTESKQNMVDLKAISDNVSLLGSPLGLLHYGKKRLFSLTKKSKSL